MSEITVIVDKDIQNLYSLPYDDRILLIEHMVETKQITSTQGDSLNTMMDALKKWNDRIQKPDILELLIRKIFLLLESGAINKKVIPIIEAFNKSGKETVGVKLISSDRLYAISKDKVQTIISAGVEFTLINLAFSKLPFTLQNVSLTHEFISKFFDMQVSYIKYMVAKTPIYRAPLAIKHVSQSPPPPYPKNKLIEKFNSLGWAKISTQFLESAIHELFEHNFFRAYVISELISADSKLITEEMTEKKKVEKWRQYQSELKVKYYNEQNAISIYLNIIEQKFKKQFAMIEDSIRKNPTLLTSGDKILKLLSNDERAAVAQEFKRRSQYTEAVLNNKCAHVALLKQFRNVISEDKQKTVFEELKSYFDKSRADQHHCKICKFIIMCSHEVEYYQLTFDKTPQPKIKAAMTKFINRSLQGTSTFCKHCGEILIDMDEKIIDTESNKIMDEELKSFLWVEVAVLMKTLKFDKLIDTGLLITNIRDAIYTFMFDMEKQILKSKTNTASEIRSKKRLYATIYAYAYIIRLILSNDNISFKNFQASSKNPLIDNIKHAIGVIMTIRNVETRDISGMNQDIVKNSLIDAYKLMNTMGSQIITVSDAAEDLGNILQLDPVYHYIGKFNELKSKTGGAQPSKQSTKSTKQSKQLKSAKSAKRALVNEQDTRVTELISQDAFSKIKRPHVTKADITAHKSYKISNLNNLHQILAYLSFNQFADSLESRYYIQQIYKESGKPAPRDDPMAIAEPLLNKAYLDNWQAWKNIIDQESIYLFLKRASVAKIFSNFGSDTNRMFINQHNPISRIFDEDGNPHKFDLLVSEDKEYSAGQLAAMVSQNNTNEDILGAATDYRCSVCKILKSEVSSLDNSKILLSLDAKVSIGNFYSFYEQRCLLGGVHDFDGSVCKKCELNNKWQLHTPELLNFYKKHRQLYLEQKETLNPSIVLTKPLPLPDIVTDFTSWAYNYNIVVSLSKLIDINVKLLSSLGSTENVEYTDVVSGTYIPVESEETYTTRNFKIISYIRNLYSEYTLLRNIHTSPKLSNEMTKLFEDSEFPKHKWEELSSLLPTFTMDAEFLDFQRQRRPRDMTNYLIQIFCENCMKILEHNDALTMSLRKLFITRFVQKILRGEELLSKYGYFNWSSLFSEIHTEASDANYVEDDDNEVAADDDDDEQGRPMENMFDNDPDVEEDEGNQIRVEGYGLD